MWYFQGARRKRCLLSEHLALVRLVRLVLLENVQIHTERTLEL